MSDATRAPDRADHSAWQRFWNPGGWWRALLVAVVYLAIYFGISLLSSSLFTDYVDAEDPLASAAGVIFGLALPILIMGLLTLAFVYSLGWHREIFGRQPVVGHRWMWLAVVAVVVPIVLRLFGTDWSAYAVSVVLSIMFLGLCVGLAEELLTRGVAVNLLRRGGHGERVVFGLSSLIFGLLHASNLVSGQAPVTVLVTVVYAFGFGAMMYLSMLATGRIVWAILLHAATDPTTLLATGGIDAHGTTSGDAELLSVAGLFGLLYVAAALVAIFFVTGTASAKPATTAADG